MENGVCQVSGSMEWEMDDLTISEVRPSHVPVNRFRSRNARDRKVDSERVVGENSDFNTFWKNADACCRNSWGMG